MVHPKTAQHKLAGNAGIIHELCTASNCCVKPHMISNLNTSVRLRPHKTLQTHSGGRGYMADLYGGAAARPRRYGVPAMSDACMHVKFRLCHAARRAYAPTALTTTTTPRPAACTYICSTDKPTRSSARREENARRLVTWVFCSEGSSETAHGCKTLQRMRAVKMICREPCMHAPPSQHNHHTASPDTAFRLPPFRMWSWPLAVAWTRI